MGHVTKPAKAGCEGCVYEHFDKCPVDTEEVLKFDFTKCTDETNNESVIFVEGE